MTPAVQITPMLPGPLVRDEAGKVVGRGPAEPAPFLLTADEVSRFLRIDEDVATAQNPDNALYQRLRDYRRRNLLRGTRAGECGKNVRYPLPEVLGLLERLTEGNSQHARGRR
ncbi:MAG: hypothetical protein AAGI54_00575 [Planctomycetota bacterium]